MHVQERATKKDIAGVRTNKMKAHHSRENAAKKSGKVSSSKTKVTPSRGFEKGDGFEIECVRQREIGENGGKSRTQHSRLIPSSSMVVSNMMGLWRGGV